MGVTVFFVLSGFILTVTYREALSRPDATSVWNFAVARVARIYPVYLLVLAFVVLQERADGKSTGGWWLHALGGQAWSGDVQTTYRFNSPAWSVGVELFLYACLPLLLFVLAGVLASARGSLVLGVVVGRRRWAWSCCRSTGAAGASSCGRTRARRTTGCSSTRCSGSATSCSGSRPRPSTSRGATGRPG